MKIKELLFKCICSVLFGTIVYLIAKISFVSSLCSLVVINIGLDHIFEQYTVVKKIIAENQYNDFFNSDYYDLYWWFSKARLQVLLNIQMVILPLFGEIVQTNNIFLGVAIYIAVMLVGLGLGVAICEIPHNSRVLERLIVLKKQNYSIYTPKENKVLSELK